MYAAEQGDFAMPQQYVETYYKKWRDKYMVQNKEGSWERNPSMWKKDEDGNHIEK